MECRVEFDYAAQESDELTLKKGDVITNVVQKMDGWWEGSLGVKRGMFPDNFVKTISPSLNSSTNSGSGDSLNNTKEEVQLRKATLNKSRRLKALFSYAPEQDDELPLEVGDLVEFIAEVEEGWWRGKLKGRVGIFPSNFVKDDQTTNGTAQESGKIEEHKVADKHRIGKGVPDIVKSDRTSINLDDEPAPELPPKPVREIAKCFYPYQASNEDELTLNEGDVVTIISKSCEDEGWWRGELRGKTGLFPDNFVKIISPNDPVISSSNSNSSQPQQKILAQGRNIPSPGVEAVPKEGPTSPGITAIDGIGASKALEKEKSFEGKFKFTSKAKLKEAAPPPPVERPPLPKPPILTPVSPAVNVTLPVVVKQESKKPNIVARGENSEDMGDFNAVERTEKLSHLTATRAKAPKRRPPSTIITRDNDINVMNGSVHSQEHILDSPPAHHSTPFNLSHNTSNGTGLNLTSSVNSTPSNSVHDGPSLSNSSSILSPKETSMNSNTSVNSTSTAAKSKKTLPWMVELKQTQDKKRASVGPLNNAITNTSNIVPPASNTSLPSPTLTTPQPSPTPPPIVTTPKEREPAPLPGGIVAAARAPPLPAKPSTLIHQNSEKSSVISPGTNPAPASFAKKFLGKKLPSTEIVPGQGTNIYSNSNSVNDSHGDTSNANAIPFNKSYVTFEEHAKVRDRVSSLENELETMKRQLKILLDREMNQGHIV